jgi:hypothetical protein
MATLTREQLAFLKKYGVNKNETFDATNIGRSEYKIIMKEEGYQVAYGVTACAKGNHTLRNKAGNCLQCQPQSFTKKAQYYDGGFIYVAFSNENNIIKIGITKNINNRQKALRQQGYGGIYDWTISLHKKVDKNAGEIESKAKKKLKIHQFIGEYMKDGKMQRASEMYNFSVEKAFKIIKNIADEIS